MGSGEHDVLIIKLLIPNKDKFSLRVIFDHLLPRAYGPYCFSSNKVIFIAEYLSNSAMSALYSIADFYLSAPHTEGYNLPLLEAMAHGTVPVSNASTAMSDYVSQENAVVVSENSYPALIKGMAGDIAGKTFSVPISSRFDIGRAVRRSRHLSEEERQLKARAARDKVIQNHSEEAIARLAIARLKALADNFSAFQDIQ